MSAVLVLMPLTGLPALAQTSGSEAPDDTPGFRPGAEDEADAARIAGPDRFATAAAVSARAFPDGAASVYLARADVLSDALTAGTLTDGPTLLVPSCGSPPDIVVDEIERLDPQEVVALGGEEAVCPELLAAAAAGRDSGRVAGADRLETAAAIAGRAFPDGADRVFLAAAAEGPDALAAGGLTDGPVLLVPGDGPVPDAVRDAVAAIDPREVVAIGGVSAVDDDVLNESAEGRGAARLGGDDRFATTSVVANYQFGVGSPVRAEATTVYLARADVFADAVVAGALTDGPVLLVPSCGELPVATANQLRRLAAGAVAALGGVDAVCDEILDAAAAERPQPVRFADDVRQLAPADVASIQPFDGGVTFDPLPDSLEGITRGDILVGLPTTADGPLPFGLLGRVEAVEPDGALARVTLQDVTLPEVVPDGTLQASDVPLDFTRAVVGAAEGLSGTQSAPSAAPAFGTRGRQPDTELTLPFGQTDPVVFYDGACANGIPCGRTDRASQLSAQGQTRIRGQFDLDVELEGGELQRFSWSTDTTLQSDLMVRWGGQLGEDTLNVNAYDPDRPSNARRELIPPVSIPTPIGGVPLAVTLRLYPGLEGKLVVKASVGLQWTQSDQSGGVWTRDGGFVPLVRGDSGEDGLDFQVGQPRAEVELYGYLEPALALGLPTNNFIGRFVSDRITEGPVVYLQAGPRATLGVSTAANYENFKLDLVLKLGTRFRLSEPFSGESLTFNPRPLEGVIALYPDGPPSGGPSPEPGDDAEVAVPEYGPPALAQVRQDDDMVPTYGSVVAGDGATVVFTEGFGTNGSGASLPKAQIYRRALDADQQELVSVGTDGGTADAASGSPTVSGDGRYVAFASIATDLVDGTPVTADGAGTLEFFLRDTVRGTTEWISRSSSSNANTTFRRPDFARLDISDDGRRVVFESFDPGLVADDGNGAGDVFLYEAESGDIERVNVEPDGTESGTAAAPRISGDGRFVVFFSPDGIAGERAGLYLKDVESGALEYVSGAAGDRDEFVYYSQIDDAGDTIVYGGQPPEDADPSARGRCYVHETSSGETTALREQISCGALSGDGNVLWFASEEALTDDDENGVTDVYATTITGDDVRRVSRGVDEERYQFGSGPSSLDADGSVGSFQSSDDGVVPGEVVPTQAYTIGPSSD